MEIGGNATETRDAAKSRAPFKGASNKPLRTLAHIHLNVVSVGKVRRLARQQRCLLAT